MTTDRKPADRRSADRLNLSRRPFVNNRPVTRTAILLWALGFLLLLVNVFSFWSYLESSREKRADVKAGEAKLAAAHVALARREEQVSRLDLGRQNDEVAYLNTKIAQRTFSWSRLMDRLAAVMPNDVRLQHLSLSGLADEREGRQVRRVAARRQSLDRFTLTIDGQARSEEALLELVDNLTDYSDQPGHSYFADPNPTHEARDAGDLIRFNLTVGYLPNAQTAGYVRPPAHRWKLSPLPGSAGAPGATGPIATPQLQAAAPAPPPTPAFRTTTRPLPPSAPPVAGTGFGPAPRPVLQPQRPANDPLRGVGSPFRRRTLTPPPSETVPNEQGRPSEQGRR